MNAGTRLLAAPAPDLASIAALLAAPHLRERGALLEHEGLALLEAAGIATPRRLQLPSARAAAALADPPLRGERVVLKALVPGLLHKTEADAVRVIPNRRQAVADAAAAMERHLAGRGLAGFLLCEFVPHEAGFGSEFLLGLRWSRDFGPIVTLGPGGLHAEFMAAALGEHGRIATFSPRLDPAGAVERALADLAPARLATSPQRGRAPALPAVALADAVRRFLALAAAFCPEPLAELEVNPLVVSDGALVALDVVAVLGRGPERLPAPRPLEKLRRLLTPRSIAVVGVSEKLNPGRMILKNILREGFDPERVTVVKPGAERIDGCRCVPDLAALPEPVDLAVLAVAAPQAADLLAEIAGQRRAESVVLIAGGLEEKPGCEPLVARMRDCLAAARARPDRGPLVIGGNCLGVRSVPGRFNTLFIPDHKLPLSRGAASPLALVTGSGAFAVSKLSKLAGLNPRYVVTVGNQTDVTTADLVEFLRDDPEVRVFALYLEGLKTLDGARLLETAAALTAEGRTVILYRAGRTPAGAAAAASHTAAVAGDAVVTRPLMETAGVVVADTLDDFEDLVRLLVYLEQRPPTGLRLGAMSNAGYECVAIADSLGPFALARFAEATTQALRATLAAARLGEIVAVRNPMDVTPLLGDADYEAIVRLILSDPGVDAGLVGCVPLTGALDTLAAGPGHGEDVGHPDGLAAGLVRLGDEIARPWVVVVDAGRLYDPLVRRLEDGGLLVFRTADRALRLFGRACARRLGRTTLPLEPTRDVAPRITSSR